MGVLYQHARGWTTTAGWKLFARASVRVLGSSGRLQLLSMSISIGVQAVVSFSSCRMYLTQQSNGMGMVTERLTGVSAMCARLSVQWLGFDEEYKWLLIWNRTFWKVVVRKQSG